jgi:hypothetical protein
MLNLYLDDSGEREQSVGGCIADVKSWKAFEFAWGELLESVGNISTLPRRSPPRVIAGPRDVICHSQTSPPKSRCHSGRRAAEGIRPARRKVLDLDHDEREAHAHGEPVPRDARRLLQEPEDLLRGRQIRKDQRHSLPAV